MRALALIACLLPASAAFASGADIFSPEFGFVHPAGHESGGDAISLPAPRDDATVRLLINGEASFVERMRMIDEAERSIYLQVLIFKADAVGNAIASALIRKKRDHPEVDIRVIVDAYSNIQDLEAQLMYFELKDAGIEVEGYEAFYLHWLNEINLRDWTAGNKRYHEKYMVVDGRAAVVGGMNIGDEYARYGTDPLLIWRDQDIYLEGDVVQDVEAAFLDNIAHFKEIKAQWPSALNTDVYWEVWQGVHPQLRDLVTQSLDKRRERSRAEIPAWDQLHLISQRVGRPLHGDIKVRFIRSRPRKGESYIEQAYLHLVDNARSSIVIENAYFVPTKPLLDALVAAAGRGVRVTVITNSKATNDIPIITDAGRLSYQPLIKAGVEVYEWHAERHGEGTVHSKYAVIDSEIAIIGSYNLDPRSLGLNSENVVIVGDPRIAADLASYTLLEDLPMADRITAEQAVEWSDPDLVPALDQPPPLWNEPLFDAGRFELFLMRQVEKSL